MEEILCTKKVKIRASRVAQYSSALHRSTSCATRDPGFAPRLCRSRLRLGGPWGEAQLALASTGLGRAWLVWISFSHRAQENPVVGQVQCTLTKVARCMVFPPTHWGGLVGLCFVGRMAFDLRLS
jgi:hypothetical protein